MKYDHAKLTCDIVMKGGITSGVVYPSAVCELAQTYKFKNVGGTSAGAIAAAATAAAEYGRATSSGGFTQLEELPTWLSTGTNLSDLFQAGPLTTRLYSLALAFLGSMSPFLKAIRGIGTALIAFWPATAFAIVLDALIWRYLGLGAPGNPAQETCVWIVMALVIAVAIAWTIWHDVEYGLTENGFGLCNGMDRGAGKPRPLTDWLTGELDKIAGIDGTAAPLTFGDLWSPPGSGHARWVTAPVESIPFADLPPLEQVMKKDPLSLDPAINLRMVTSCLTLGAPHALPFSERIFFFDPKLTSKYFPRRVLQWMCDHGAQPRTQREALEFELLKPLLPLPPPEYFPVVVATRLSLSFPILLSAVPFFAVDWGRKRDNELAGDALDAFVVKHQADGLVDLQRMSKIDRRAAGLTLFPETCWFSDGGISSNFPITFFDAPIPRWPTFAIDLDTFSIDTGNESSDESKNVWMPKSNLGGLLPVWNRFSDSDRRVRLVGFLGAILDTMQNWVDNAQMRTPGYRDRVAHVLLSADEGGLNLTMPKAVVRKLIVRGVEAAKLMVYHFANPDTHVKTTWLNHRWARFRSFLAMIEPMTKDFAGAFDSGDPSYRELSNCSCTTPLPSYHWKTDQCAVAGAITSALLEAGTVAVPGVAPLVEGAPHPPPELVARPRL
jgi:hypothetical protein